ncbi:DUF2325 domain-containing protein [Noviherbaspirillum sp. Root189]|uniref:DUF2325 domain-containing protein n=1 Tax=Noviherbaspirillum sp. Root189 TaxID=1736487 RepID=UPI00138F9CEB|nr:DUF2325 domain-containing protein [Noviherbaspirillum sp. Root189]
MCSTERTLSTSCPQPQSTPSGFSRRRLWELSSHCHCPLIGVCLPLAALHRLLAKAVGPCRELTDYEAHTRAVAACAARSPFTKLLQRELDQRHALTIVRFRAAKTAEELEAMWMQSLDSGDIAGAFWAAVTHGQCHAVLEERLCRDMHMLQHQAGAEMRESRARLAAMKKDNQELADELCRTQERSKRVQKEKLEKLAWLDAALIRARADNIAKDTLIGSLRAELDDMKQALPDLLPRLQLKQQIARLQDRVAMFERENMMAKMACTMSPGETAYSNPAQSEVTVPPASTYEDATGAVALARKHVLCVGGRDGNVAGYRKLIEHVGGRFAHHDGGRQDNLKQLDNSLAAADLVICQTGCISHNAYWRVKEHCKRTGTRCMFIDNPSMSKLSKSLDELSITATALKDEQE